MKYLICIITIHHQGLFLCSAFSPIDQNETKKRERVRKFQGKSEQAVNMNNNKYTKERKEWIKRKRKENENEIEHNKHKTKN